MSVQNDLMTIGDMFGGTTTHRIVTRGGVEHRDAVFPEGAQATVAVGDIEAVTDNPPLSGPAFGISSLVDELTEGGRMFRATVVALLVNDPDRVEVVSGFITGTADKSDPDEYDIGETGVMFDDGTFVYMYGILSLRVEL